MHLLKYSYPYAHTLTRMHLLKYSYPYALCICYGSKHSLSDV